MKESAPTTLDTTENDALAHGALGIVDAEGPTMENMGEHAGKDGEIGETPQPQVRVWCYRHVVILFKMVGQ